jgi:hypothetical protein
VTCGRSVHFSGYSGRLPISFRLTGPHFVCLYSLDCPLWLSSINLTVSQMTKLCLQEFQFAVKFFNFPFGKQSKVRCINDFNNTVRLMEDSHNGQSSEYKHTKCGPVSLKDIGNLFRLTIWTNLFKKNGFETTI